MGWRIQSPAKLSKWWNPDHQDRLNQLVSQPRVNKHKDWHQLVPGCIQTMEKRKMDWLHPDHKEKKNGLVSSRPWRKEIWTGFIQTIEKRKMDWLYPDHRDLRNINSMRLAQSVVEVVLSEALSWWSELWCTKNYLICGDILKIENHSEYNPQIQWKQSNTCLLSDTRRH